MTRRNVVGKKLRLMAANGTEITVYGEATLGFVGDGGGEGSMQFSDADVEKPLGAGSAMEDEKYWRFMENDGQGNVFTSRENNTYVMKLMAHKTGTCEKAGE